MDPVDALVSIKRVGEALDHGAPCPALSNLRLDNIEQTLGGIVGSAATVAAETVMSGCLCGVFRCECARAAASASAMLEFVVITAGVTCWIRGIALLRKPMARRRHSVFSVT